jgi:hypothetical protein
MNKSLKAKEFISKLKKTPTFLKSTWSSFSKPKKILFALSLSALFVITIFRSLALNYQLNNKDQDYEFGTTFIASRAEELGVDPQKSYLAILDDLKLKNIRLVSHWSALEKEKGIYDFSNLDWQFKEAEKRGVDISLSLGLRQPRWPECHMPDWSKNLTKEEWYPPLKVFISEVVKRYKDSPSLKSYQLENEFFLKEFGECPDFSRERLIEEFNLVKSIDSETPIILSRSNNYGGFAIGQPQPDIVGISVYRKVHNPTLGYITYPFPAWYYAFLAQGQLSLTGKPSIIHEFQLEPWLASGNMPEASIEEQNKTMSVKDIKKNIDFAKRTGIKEVYFWGAEWWYWRAQNGDPTIWNTVKEELNR